MFFTGIKNFQFCLQAFDTETTYFMIPY